MRYLVLAALLFAGLFSGCTPKADQNYDVAFSVKNNTILKLTDASMFGKEYPGSFGNSVPNGNKVIVTRSPQLGSAVDVSWIDPVGKKHTMKFMFPNPVRMIDSMEVVLQFSADESVALYIDYANSPRVDATVIHDEKASDQ
ncbi:MAG: hypothetical protein AB8C95_02375 [Phycisphaeraceae bacterium]